MLYFPYFFLAFSVLQQVVQIKRKHPDITVFFVKISIYTAQQYIPTEFKEQFYTYINIYIFDVRVFWK